MHGLGDGDELFHRHLARERDHMIAGRPTGKGVPRLGDQIAGDRIVPVDGERRHVVDQELQCALSIEAEVAVGGELQRRDADAEPAERVAARSVEDLFRGLAGDSGPRIHGADEVVADVEGRVGEEERAGTGVVEGDGSGEAHQIVVAEPERCEQHPVGVGDVLSSRLPTREV